jgi:Protein of unknown function (DUF2934)
MGNARLIGKPVSSAIASPWLRVDGRMPGTTNDLRHWSPKPGASANEPVPNGPRLKVFRKPPMEKPSRIQVVRRAYELWEKAGKPEGRDQEFYHEAERELENEPASEIPEDI